MAVRSLLHPLLQHPHGSAILSRLEEQLERADRLQADELAAGISRRMVATELALKASSRTAHNKRRTRCELRPLAFPVFFEGRMCTCAVNEKFVIGHPREHLSSTHWFTDIASAKLAFPEARLLEDVPSVSPCLESN
jgi:hypothetical protein